MWFIRFWVVFAKSLFTLVEKAIHDIEKKTYSKVNSENIVFSGQENHCKNTEQENLSIYRNEKWIDRVSFVRVCLTGSNKFFSTNSSSLQGKLNGWNLSIADGFENWGNLYSCPSTESISTISSRRRLDVCREIFFDCRHIAFGKWKYARCSFREVRERIYIYERALIILLIIDNREISLKSSIHEQSQCVNTCWRFSSKSFMQCLRVTRHLTLHPERIGTQTTH